MASKEKDTQGTDKNPNLPSSQRREQQTGELTETTDKPLGNAVLEQGGLGEDKLDEGKDDSPSLMAAYSKMLIPEQFDTILNQIEKNIQDSQAVITNTLADTRKMVAQAKEMLQAPTDAGTQQSTSSAQVAGNQFLDAVQKSQQQIANTLASQTQHEQTVLSESSGHTDSAQETEIHSQAQFAHQQIAEAEKNITNTIMGVNSSLQGQFASQNESISRKQQVLQNLLANTQVGQPEVPQNTQQSPGVNPHGEHGGDSQT
ncbi:hypothetical protein [Sessilibacter corallicola]|uniref:Uncharacterized protein n=1 Tax=Sessilibacter corallicola TaxID=2904075 RepID=A0ABQ0A5G3_9GAMM